MLTTRPRGTNDILPNEIADWHHMEEVLRHVSRLYGYSEIRTPIFEHTELFQRGVGETTDIVEKEMYTFIDRGERSLTLRPEGTASAVRAYVENKLFAGPQPTKMFYLGPMFRYDRPQAGRYRQFHQFGVEVFGSRDPSIDAEVIAMAMDIYTRLGLKNLLVELNSVGCTKCRPLYRKELQKFLEKNKHKLCATCQERYDRNPMRIFDCKNENCQALLQDAPTIAELLCVECREHFEKVQEYLQAVDISFHLNPSLVRGLDYYVQTAFEIVARGIGAQSSIGGGGRYDGLVEQCGGPTIPGIGYAMGLERMLLTLQNQEVKKEKTENIDVFIATLGEKAHLKGAVLAQQLRHRDLYVEYDYLKRSLKAQLKAADRYQASYTIIIGEEELNNNQAVVRKMEDGSQASISLTDIEKYFINKQGRD